MRRVDDYEFRVWDELSKQMIYFTFGEIYHEFRQYYYGNYIEKNGRKIYLTAEGGQSNPELHVMQYTGLRDKNGVKIFEGDILRVTDGADEIDERNINTGIGEVVWLDEWLLWYVLNVNNGLGDLNWDGYLEVIGNKWDNPELLEVE